MLEAQDFALAATTAVAVAPFRAIVSLAGRVEMALPGPGRVMRQGGDLILWAGVGTWLLVSDDMTLEARMRAVAGAVVTDQSDGRVIFWVGGERARWILAKLAPVDLDEAVFGEDCTALTLAGHIPVQIWREDGKFAVACFRSFGESLHHALVRAEKG